MDAADALDVEGLRSIFESREYRDQCARLLLQEWEDERAAAKTGKLKLDSIVFEMALVLREHLSQSNLIHKTRITALEKRIAELEARPSMKYYGVWEPKNYAPGAFVTANGSVWHCRTPAGPNDAPNASHCWQLAVKRGRDAQRERA
jgi:BMFP domain-containing protein YqiC